MAINTGVDASKLVGYGALAPPAGVDVTKLRGYGLLAPPVGVDVSKLVLYGVLAATNTNPPVWSGFAMPPGYLNNVYVASWDLAPSAAPTTYSRISGSLPPGLALSSPFADTGNITGNPSVVGTYTFTLRATNAYGTADRAFSITISIPSGGGNFGWVS